MLDYPNSTLARCKEFSDSIYETFEYFWQSGKCNVAVWLVLESLDKLDKKNNEFKTSIGNLKSPDCKDKLIKAN